MSRRRLLAESSRRRASAGDGANAVTALHDVNVGVRAGEFVSIMGPSGSGKSTLLNLIAGLDVPTAGRVVVHGEDLAALSDDARSALRLRRIGFVFQSFNLFPTFTAEENVAWPLEFLGASWRDAAARANEVLSHVGLNGAARKRRPGELSGGEQQRVAIARALVTRPACCSRTSRPVTSTRERAKASSTSCAG